MIILLGLLFIICFTVLILESRSFATQLETFNKNQLEYNRVNLQFETRKRQSIFLNNMYSHAYIFQSKQARINQILDEISETLGWKINSYWEFNETGQYIEIKYQRGMSPEYITALKKYLNNRIEVGGLGSGRAISTKQPVIVNNWKKDPYLRGIDFLADIGNFACYGAFPIVTNKQLYGVLGIYGSKTNLFKLNEAQLFTTIANSLGAILENDELEQERR